MSQSLNLSADERMERKKLQREISEKSDNVVLFFEEHGFDRARDGASFNKPGEAIKIAALKSQDSFSLNDRLVLNLMQGLASAKLDADGYNGEMIEMSLPKMSKATGIDVRDIRASINKLRHCEVHYKRLDEHKDSWTGTSFLFAAETKDVKDGDKYLFFSYIFPPRIMQIFKQPEPYGRINLGMAFSCKSRWTLALYENLCLYLDRDVPEWTVSVETLTKLMGWTRQVDFAIFRRDCVNLAVSELNELWDCVEVRVHKVPDKRDTRKTAAFRFEIVKLADELSVNYEGRAVRSVIPMHMPPYFADDLEQSPEQIAAHWAAFRASHATEMPTHMGTAFRSYVRARVDLNKRDDSRHVTPGTIQRVYQEWKGNLERLGIKTSKIGCAVLLEIWHYRLEEAFRLGADGRTVLDQNALNSVSVFNKRDQDTRDCVFEKIINREAYEGWPLIAAEGTEAVSAINAERARNAYKPAKEDVVKDRRRVLSGLSVKREMRDEWLHEVDEETQREFKQFIAFKGEALFEDEYPCSTFAELESSKKALNWHRDWRRVQAEAREKYLNSLLPKSEQKPLVEGEEDEDIPF
jgi:hypothetical protein